MNAKDQALNRKLQSVRQRAKLIRPSYPLEKQMELTTALLKELIEIVATDRTLRKG